MFDEGGQNPSYIIKIGEYAGTGALSKIRVSNICDNKGQNCKSIAELSTGTEINGTNGEICVKVDNNTLNCTEIVVNSNPTLSRSRTDTIGKVNGTALTVTMPANPHKIGKNIIGTSSGATANTTTTNTNTYLNHVEDSNVTSSLRIQGTGATSVSSSNGTLTINSTNTWQKNTKDQEGYVTKPNASDAGKVRKVGTDGNPAWLADAGTTYTADDGLSLASNVFKAKLKSYTRSTNAAIDGGTNANRLYAVSLDKNGKLSVNVPRTGAGGDSLWKQPTGANYIVPKSSNLGVAVGNDLLITAGNTILYTGPVSFQPTCTNSTCAVKALHVDQYGHVGIGGNVSSSYPLFVHGSSYFQTDATFDGINTFNGAATFTAGATFNGDDIVNIKGTRFYDNKVLINKYNSTSNSTLQVNGGINITNNYNPTNGGTCSYEGAIEYYNGYFYGCMKGNGTTPKWRRFYDDGTQQQQGQTSH